MVVSAPASRNALCPCGSGRRYKDCHGALGGAAGGSGRADTAAARRVALMQEALALQQAGDIAGAIARYQSVLADDAENFDALHMLGVAFYQQHDLTRAEESLRHAIACNPAVPVAQQNLALVLEAQRLVSAEDALCRAAMPLVAPSCAPADAFAAVVAGGRPLDVLVGMRECDPNDGLLARIAGSALGPVRMHRLPARDGGPLQGARATLDAPALVMYGIDEPLDAFGTPADGCARVLVVTRDAPARVHDRIAELSAYGREQVHVRYASALLKRAIGLPGGVLLARDAAPPMHRA
jgi:tetratricopeptide (TPR) repeat protein